MNPESTDRLPIDTNADIPRIIYRKEFTVTTSTSGAGYVEKTDTITSPFILSAYNDFDLCIKTTDNKIYNAPVRTYTSSMGHDVWLDIYLDSANMVDGNSKAVYTYRIRKYGGATTDTYTCWLVLWSTKISDDLNLFT